MNIHWESAGISCDKGPNQELAKPLQDQPAPQAGGLAAPQRRELERI